jgi:tyrosinase
VNLGPLGNPNAAPGPDGGLGYNPRCLKRDINPTTAQRFNNLNDILNLLTQNHDIYDFQMQLQGVPGIGIGAHGGGHYTIGGDASDLFASPADPAFFLHHGQVDRMWTIWQSLDPEARTYALAQTRTYLDLPPSEDTTLDDIIELGYSGGEQKKIRELMSVVQGDFCYIYV